MDAGPQLEAFALAPDRRAGGLAQASERWSRLAYGAALAFVANLYASPAFYWPDVFEKARLGVVTSAVCALAVLMHRITSGRPLRLGGPAAGFLLAYMAMIPLSLAWTISPDRTWEAVFDIGKLLVVYVALLNALDTPGRVRGFLVVGALATLAPSLGGIQRWLEGDALVEGYRTAWRGNYADPNRLAMGLVLFLPAAILLASRVRRPWLRALLLFAAAANVAAMVLTYSRSGSLALVAALLLTFLRGRAKGKGLVMAGVALLAVVALAPQTFWMRQSTIAEFEEDASFQGRERAYNMLQVIFDERPLRGVGAGAFLDAWTRYAPLKALGQHLIAHNIFMEILGELGIIALALFGIYCGWLLWRLWRAGGEPGGAAARALFAGLIGYLLCELVNGYTRSFNLYAAFGLSVAIVVQTRLRRRLAADEGLTAARAAA
jgi:O-antigen ligase